MQDGKDAKRGQRGAVVVREGTAPMDLQEWVRRYVALVLEMDRAERLAPAA